MHSTLQVLNTPNKVGKNESYPSQLASFAGLLDIEDSKQT